MNLFDNKKKIFPPVPEWQPSFTPSLEDIIKTFEYYVNGDRDFVVFKNGTVVILNGGFDDEKVVIEAKQILSNIFNFHPDMKPQSMDDGNILISYNYPAYNIAFEKMAQEHWTEIDANYLKGLATHEVLITPLGPNKFDDFGKKAIWGRCYFFMDAQKPEVQKIIRKRS